MSEESETPAPDVVSDNRLRLDAPYMKTFFSLLANTLLVSLINFTVWFAITFYVFLQTRSVFAAAMISGIYLVATALTGIWFGSLIDHHSKNDAAAFGGVLVGDVRGRAGVVLDNPRGASSATSPHRRSWISAQYGSSSKTRLLVGP